MEKVQIIGRSVSQSSVNWSSTVHTLLKWVSLIHIKNDFYFFSYINNNFNSIETKIFTSPIFSNRFRNETNWFIPNTISSYTNSIPILLQLQVRYGGVIISNLFACLCLRRGYGLEGARSRPVSELLFFRTGYFDCKIIPNTSR